MRALLRGLVDQADLILGMTSQHVREVIRMRKEAGDKTFLFKNFPDGEIDGEPVIDPIGASLETYNKTFLEIGEYLGNMRVEIVKRIDEKTSGS
jgi:protein-tyrosine-phosphatase